MKYFLIFINKFEFTSTMFQSFLYLCTQRKNFKTTYHVYKLSRVSEEGIGSD